MALALESLDVDLTIQSEPLTEKEADAITAFISLYKMQKKGQQSAASALRLSQVLELHRQIIELVNSIKEPYLLEKILLECQSILTRGQAQFNLK